MKRILIVEDDVLLNKTLTYNLTSEGYDVASALNFQIAAGLLAGTEYDLALLDVNLPDGSGYDLCRLIKPEYPDTLIIFLTANDRECDQIRGYEAGAVDYITKPFKLGELCSRINALLRRSGRKASGEGERLKSGPVEIDLSESRVRLAGKNLELTGAEYRLLCFFLKNRNRVLTRTMILNAMWDDNGSFVDDNTLSVYIRRLREKIEDDPSNPRYLKTVRGFGYQWKAEEL